MIRHYEAIGLIPRPRTGNPDIGIRTRRTSTLSVSFPIEEIGKLLALWQDRSRASADLKALATARAEELRRKKLGIRSMRQSLAQLARNCHGDARPDVRSLRICGMKNDVFCRLRNAFIARSPRRLYLRWGMLRLLSSLFVVMALFFSPVAMASGAAMAMPHAAPVSGNVSVDHCAGDEAPTDDNKSGFKLSCGSACAAVTPNDHVRSAEAPPVRPSLATSGHQILVGIHPERETPPPRITPEI